MPLWLLSPSGIALGIQLSAICCGGQSGKVINLLAWRCLPLGHPLWQVALPQLYKYHHQSGNATSGKLVWKQHKNDAWVKWACIKREKEKLKTLWDSIPWSICMDFQFRELPLCKQGNWCSPICWKWNQLSQICWTVNCLTQPSVCLTLLPSWHFCVPGCVNVCVTLMD